MQEESSIEIVRTADALRVWLGERRGNGATVGVVPTMGALHRGHFSLVERAVDEMDHVCVTIFVNPKQFGPDEDFTGYPRDEVADAAALDQRGVELIYVPDKDEIYPDEFATVVSVPGIGDRLEGTYRPGFFSGVVTVVNKLLMQTTPDVVYFGEKDYQQLCVLGRMVADLDMPVEIRACPIVREIDGLAMSSRNAYLSNEERAIAPALYRVLQELRDRLHEGEPVLAASIVARTLLSGAGFTKIDYISAYARQSFEETDKPDSDTRLLAAAWLGQTRLIDNLPFNID